MPLRRNRPTRGSWAPFPQPTRQRGSKGQQDFGHSAPTQQEQYGAFRASLLFCPTCRKATPVRERLLLVLPSGNLYEYLCMECGTSTGSKTERDQSEGRLFIP